MEILKEILHKLFIIQIVDNKEREKRGLKRLGNGHLEAYRFNPYNPLSYLCIIITCFFGIMLNGPVGFFTNLGNPFKWD